MSGDDVHVSSTTLDAILRELAGMRADLQAAMGKLIKIETSATFADASLERLWGENRDLAARVAKMEAAMPTNNLVKTAVFGFIALAMGALVSALLMVVVRQQPQTVNNDYSMQERRQQAPLMDPYPRAKP